MLGQFPLPILSIAEDVVKELDGEDALFGLWTVFTKCKESLTDGRRLENISWRLWYQEMAVSHRSPSSSPGSLSPPSELRSPSPLTPVSEDGPDVHRADSSHDLLVPNMNIAAAHSWHGDHSAHPAITASRRLSSSSMPFPQTHKRNPLPGVGKIIYDIVPGKFIAPTSRSIPGVRMSNKAEPTPTPPRVTQTPPAVILPTVQLPSSSSAAPPFPRVVVVNPTPRPTPPATRGSSPVVSVLAPKHLLPPVHAQPKQKHKALASGAKLAHSATLPVRMSSTGSAGTSDSKPYETTSQLVPQGELPTVGSVKLSRADSSRTAVALEPSPSSATSSQLSHAKSDGVISRRIANKGPVAQGRKTKEGARNSSRPAMRRANTNQRQAILHREHAVGGSKKAAFAVGSVSSNGSKGYAAVAPSKPPVVTRDPVVPKPRPPSPPHLGKAVTPARRGIVVSTSSEYETDSEDDSEWASETGSVEESEKAKKHEDKLREAAEEAQRQRDMFAKVPKRSYSNLNRTQSGLLTQLLHPDPQKLPANHPYRTTQSSGDITQLGRHAPFGSSLTSSKSSAAVPLAAQVTALAPSTNGSGGYRPKGRPQDQELEDDSDSGDENPANTVQLSRSVAQQKLEALAHTSRRRNSDRDAQPPELLQQALPSVATAPISFTHPYNLPAPALPMTPRTTRRQMLATELSESLRRNLLWERQVSKPPTARRSGVLGNPLRPLTAAHVDAPGRNTESASTSGLAADKNNPSGGSREEEQAQRKRSAMARNRSWADDYHYSGW